MQVRTGMCTLAFCARKRAACWCAAAHRVYGVGCIREREVRGRGGGGELLYSIIFARQLTYWYTTPGPTGLGNLVAPEQGSRLLQ